jgi:hypothetical protein
MTIFLIFMLTRFEFLVYFLSLLTFSMLRGLYPHHQLMLEVYEDADELRPHPHRLFLNAKFLVENAPTKATVAFKVKPGKAVPPMETPTVKWAANAPRRGEATFQVPIRLADETKLNRNQPVTLSSATSASLIEQYWCGFWHHSARVAHWHI